MGKKKSDSIPGEEGEREPENRDIDDFFGEVGEAYSNIDPNELLNDPEQLKDFIMFTIKSLNDLEKIHPQIEVIAQTVENVQKVIRETVNSQSGVLSKTQLWSSKKIDRWFTRDEKVFLDYYLDQKYSPSKILIKNLAVDHIEPSSYDLTIGRWVFFVDKPLDRDIHRSLPEIAKYTEMYEKDQLSDLPKSLVDDIEYLVENEALIDLTDKKHKRSLTINARDYVFIWSHEKIALPNNVFARVTTKMSISFAGLIQSNSRIDPGFGISINSKTNEPIYCGLPIQIPLYNATNKEIPLRMGTKYSNLIFERLPVPTIPYISKENPNPIIPYSIEFDKLTNDERLEMLRKLGGGWNIVCDMLEKISNDLDTIAKRDGD